MSVRYHNLSGVPAGTLVRGTNNLEYIRLTSGHVLYREVGSGFHNVLNAALCPEEFHSIDLMSAPYEEVTYD